MMFAVFLFYVYLFIYSFEFMTGECRERVFTPLTHPELFLFRFNSGMMFFPSPLNWTVQNVHPGSPPGFFRCPSPSRLVAMIILSATGLLILLRHEEGKSSGERRRHDVLFMRKSLGSLKVSGVNLWLAWIEGRKKEFRSFFAFGFAPIRWLFSNDIYEDNLLLFRRFSF